MRKIIPFLTTCLLGTLLHFLYDWTGGSLPAAPFSGVNESTWEHMKLLYWALFFVAATQWFLLKRKSTLPADFWQGKLLSTLAGLALIPILYYTYNGCFGKSPDWLNISIFYFCAAFTFWLESRLFTGWRVKCTQSNTLAILGFAILSFFFIYYTFCPPQLPLFQDPVRGTYR